MGVNFVDAPVEEKELTGIKISPEAKNDERSISRFLKERGDFEQFFFVHGILNPTNEGNGMQGDDNNRLIYGDVDWKTRLKILLTLKPTISGSSIHQGDSLSSFWARMGVILREGEIEKGGKQDLAVIARGLKSRGKAILQDDHLSTPDEIRRSFYGAHTYNEFTIAEPQVAGFYFCIDNADEHTASLKEVAEYANSLGMPLYLFETKKSRFYLAKYDQTTGIVARSDQPLTSKDILANKWQLSTEETETLTDEILADSPFRIETIPGGEGYFLLAEKAGREMYMGLNSEWIVRNLYPSTKTETENEILISEFTTVGQGIIKYIVKNEHLYASEIYAHQVDKSPHVKNINERSFQGSYLHLSPNNTYKIEESIQENSDFLKIMERIARDEKLETEKPFLRKMLAFYLYGYAKQAELLGGTEIAKKAYEIASLILPPEEYQAIMTKRVGSNGEFRLTREDLAKMVQ